MIWSERDLFHSAVYRSAEGLRLSENDCVSTDYNVSKESTMSVGSLCSCGQVLRMHDLFYTVRMSWGHAEYVREQKKFHPRRLREGSAFCRRLL